jgi:hypothetical protein
MPEPGDGLRLAGRLDIVGREPNDPESRRLDDRLRAGLLLAAVARLVERVAVDFDDEFVGGEEDIDLEPPRQAGDARVRLEAREPMAASDLDEPVLRRRAGRRRAPAELPLEPGLSGMRPVAIDLGAQLIVRGGYRSRQNVCQHCNNRNAGGRTERDR